MSSIRPDPRQNHLLAALPDAEWQRWLPQLECVELRRGQVLFESGGVSDNVYFPTSASVSLLSRMEGGDFSEVAVVGMEGVVGVSLFMGGESTASRAVVQSAGHGFRLDARAIKCEFNRAGAAMHLLLNYTQALIAQIAKTAACQRHHSLRQQLCRWLLLSLDRMQGGELVMTQELIANLLGEGREGMTVGASLVPMFGPHYLAPGHVSVRELGDLEARTRERYAEAKTNCEKPLPEKLAA